MTIPRVTNLTYIQSLSSIMTAATVPVAPPPSMNNNLPRSPLSGDLAVVIPAGAQSPRQAALETKVSEEDEERGALHRKRFLFSACLSLIVVIAAAVGGSVGSARRSDNASSAESLSHMSNSPNMEGEVSTALVTAASAPTIAPAVNFYRYFQGEKCDDGNTKNGDGCSREAKVEAGYVCTRNSPSTTDICLPVLCPANNFVATHTCTACATGTIRAAGDDTRGGDTQCTACAINYYVKGNVCTACDVGYEIAAGGDKAGPGKPDMTSYNMTFDVLIIYPCIFMYFDRYCVHSGE